MLALSFLLALSAWWALALAMERHHQDLLGSLPGPRLQRRLPRCAASALVLNAVLASAHPQASLAWVDAGLAWSFAALLVVAGLSLLRERPTHQASRQTQQPPAARPSTTTPTPAASTTESP